MRYTPENKQYFGSDFWRWDADRGAMVVTREGIMPYTHEGPRLYLNADKTKVVEEGSTEAAFLLVGEGGQLSDEDAAKWGLTAKAKPAPSENKNRTTAVENKRSAAEPEPDVTFTPDPAFEEQVNKGKK